MRLTLSAQLSLVVTTLALLGAVAVGAGYQGLREVDAIVQELRSEAWEASLAQTEARSAVQDLRLAVADVVSTAVTQDMGEPAIRLDLAAQRLSEVALVDGPHRVRLGELLGEFERTRGDLLAAADAFRTRDRVLSANLDPLLAALEGLGAVAAERLAEAEASDAGEDEGLGGLGELGQLSDLGDRLTVETSIRLHVLLLDRYYAYRQATVLTLEASESAEAGRAKLRSTRDQAERLAGSLLGLATLDASIPIGPDKGRIYREVVRERFQRYLEELGKSLEAHAALVEARRTYRMTASGLERQLDAIAQVVADALAAAEQKLAGVRTKAEERLSQVSAGGVLTLLVTILYVVFYLSRPLRKATDAVGAFSAGTLSEEVPDSTRGDEVGDLYRALRAMVGTVAGREQALRTVATEHTSAIQGTATALTQLRENMHQVRRQAETLAGQARASVAAGEDGVRSTDSAAKSILDMSGKIEVMGKTAQGLVDSLGRIDDILASVGDIAEQAKFLALNAAIEAARSGEAGRGFGVVATEVRNLAVQSQEATAEVRTLVGEIQKATGAVLDAYRAGRDEAETGQGVVRQAESSIEQLVKAVEVAEGATDQILASVQEQSAGLDHVAEAVARINQAMSEALEAAQAR